MTESAPRGPIELVIFDCDGVLVDSERLAVRVDAIVLAQMGWPLSEEEIVERFVGRSFDVMRRALGEHLGRELTEDWDKRFDHLYVEAFERDLVAVEGIVDALDRIALPTCVASSGSHRKMRFTLGLTDLWERFDGRIFSASEVAHGKPAPDLFLHAAEQMRVAPAACAVVEDSHFGVQAALTAGMRPFGYAGGLSSAERLRAPGTVVFDDMRDLPALLARG
jgi:HAD superfamily hydrolase (TIGR01509 family)